MIEQYTIPDNSRCPKCGYSLFGLNLEENNTLVCPECNTRCTSLDMMPGSQRTRPLWRCGMIPGLLLLVIGSVGWVLYFNHNYMGMMDLMTFWSAPSVLVALVWIVISITVRVRQSDPGTYWRSFCVCLLITMAWVTPGSAVYLMAMQKAVEISAVA